MEVMLEPNALKSSLRKGERKPGFRHTSKTKPMGMIGEQWEGKPQQLGLPPSSFTEPPRIHAAHIAHANNAHCRVSHFVR